MENAFLKGKGCLYLLYPETLIPIMFLIIVVFLQIILRSVSGTVCTVVLFADWYLSQPEVVHVATFTDVIKRLNKNMHNDDSQWYRIPDDRDLIAQYILFYEMSLPFGLDLNNQIDIGKSALLLKVRIENQKAKELIEIEERAQAWLAENWPEQQVTGSSVSIMFAHIGQRNIVSMLTGSLMAILLVTLTLIVSLRSLRYGWISLLPNAFPAAMAFGIWRDICCRGEPGGSRYLRNYAWYRGG